MATASIGFQVRRHSLKRWNSESLTFNVFQHLETTHLVKPSCLVPRIWRRNCHTAHFHTSAQLIFLVGALLDSDLEFVLFVSTGSVNVKHIALVAVVSLI
jgi:hypothetical protein